MLRFPSRFAAASVLCFSVTAWSAPVNSAPSPTPKKAVQADSVADKPSVSSTNASATASAPFSVGLSSNELFLHTSATALTALIPKNDGMDIQLDFVVPQTDPFLWGLSAELKNTIHGDRDLGFHLGGGIGVGEFAKSKAFIRLGAIAGFHWTFLNRLAVHVDGGLTFAHDDVESEENQFHLTGHSSHFGLTLFYRFN